MIAAAEGDMWKVIILCLVVLLFPVVAEAGDDGGQQDVEQRARAAHLGIWALPAYQPVDAAVLPTKVEGFRIIKGRVERVGQSRVCAQAAPDVGRVGICTLRTLKPTTCRDNRPPFVPRERRGSSTLAKFID